MHAPSSDPHRPDYPTSYRNPKAGSARAHAIDRRGPAVAPGAPTLTGAYPEEGRLCLEWLAPETDVLGNPNPASIPADDGSVA